MAFTHVTSNSVGVDASSITQAVDVGSAANKVLVVGFTSDGDGLPTGVTYNGVAMTHAGNFTGTTFDVAIYYMINPPNGSNNVVASYGASGDYGMMWQVWSADGEISFDKTVDGPANATSINVATTQIEELVIGFFGDQEDSANARSPVSGVTERVDALGGSGAGDFGQWSGSRISTVTTNQAMGYTPDPGDADGAAIAFIEQPAKTVFATSVTSMPVSLPSGLVAGDALLAWVETRNACTWTKPSGWIQVANQAGGGSVGQLTVFKKIANGNEGATELFVASAGTTAVWQVRKVADDTEYLNPTIVGNTDIEASTGQLSGNILGNLITPTETGVIESISAYLVPTGTRNVVFGIYDASDDSLLGTTQPIAISGSGWFTGVFDTPVNVTASSNYYILANADGSFQCTIARAAETGAGRFVANAYTGAMPDPSGTANNNFRYSIFARYKFDVEASTASGDASNADPPNLSPSWGTTDLWFAVAGHAASSTAAFTAPPSGYSGFVNTGASSGGAAVSVASAYRNNSASSEDPGNFTAGGSNRWWAAATVAIRPVPPPSDDVTDDRNAKLTGSVNESSDRDAKLHGTDDITSERNAKLTGYAGEATNDERSAKLHGIDDISSVRSAKLTGGYETPQYLYWDKINEGTNNILTAVVTEINVDTPDDSSIDCELSNDGGSTWESVTAGTEHTFSSSGNDLRAKAILNASTDLLSAPTINEVSFIWTEAGSTNITSDRDAKITGFELITSERDAKLIGFDTDNNERNSKLTGFAETNSERDAKLTGSQDENDERSAKVHGIDDITSDRDAKLIGSQDDDDERSAKVHGTDNTNSDREAKLTGEQEDSDTRNAKTHGTDDITSDRNAKTTGIEADSEDRDAKLTGFDTDNEDREAKLVGTDDTESQREAKLVGNDTSDDERNAHLVGNETDNDIRDAKLIGSIDESDERNARLIGTADIFSDRNAKLIGFDTVLSERSAKLIGLAGSNDTRDAKLIGEADITSDKDAKLVGNDTEEDERNAKLHGTDDTESERNTKVVGFDTDNEERNAKLIGLEGANSDRNSKLIGNAEANEERSAVLVGSETISSLRNAKITGSDSANETRQAKLTANDTAEDDREAKLVGFENETDDRNAKLVGTDTASDTRNAETTGAQISNANRDAKTVGFESENDQREAKLVGNETSDSDRNAHLNGQTGDTSDRNAKLIGIEFANSENDAKTTGAETSSSNRNAKLTGFAIVRSIVVTVSSRRNNFSITKNEMSLLVEDNKNQVTIQSNDIQVNVSPRRNQVAIVKR